MVQAGNAHQNVHARVLNRELSQRREVPFDTLILPCPGEDVRRVDRHQTELKIGRKMIGEVAATRGYVANDSAPPQASMLKCSQEFAAAGTGHELHRPMIRLTAAIEDRLVRLEHVPLFETYSTTKGTPHGILVGFRMQN